MPPAVSKNDQEQALQILIRCFFRFVDGFDRWWMTLPESNRERHLAEALSRADRDAFTERHANAIRRRTNREAGPVCHLLEVVAAQYQLNASDAIAVRRFRNEHAHPKMNSSGIYSCLGLDKLTPFMLAADRLLKHFGAEQERIELRECVQHVSDLLAGTRKQVQTVGQPAKRAIVAANIAPAPDPKSLDGLLSLDQRTALDKIVHWFQGKPDAAGDSRYFVLAGPAGSGKTAIVAELVRRIDLHPSQVSILAPTGKAVLALKSKLHRGWKGRASTIAKVLWKWKHEGHRGEDNSFVKLEAKRSDRSVQLVIVDEASLVTRSDFDELIRSYRVVFTGDKYQLPAVVEPTQNALPDGEQPQEDCCVLDKPDFELASVHRHRKDSAIRGIAERVRDGGDLLPRF